MEKEKNIPDNENIISKRHIENEDINDIIIKKTKCDCSNDNRTDHTILFEDKNNSGIFDTEVKKEKKIINNCCNFNNNGNMENAKQNIVINENLEISIKESLNGTMNHSNTNNIINEQNSSLNVTENNEKESKLIQNINKEIQENKQIEIEIENSNSCTEMEAIVESAYQFPVYDFKMENTLNTTNTFFNPRCSTQNDFNDNTILNNYFKGAKWSPDGTCILTSSNDNVLRLFELPDITQNKKQEIHIEPVLKVCDGESVYDYCWYPYMKSSDPSTSVFISASRDLPIHMWDAYYGTLRASYCTYDIYDQIVAPHSINFNLDGSKIYAGLNNLIQIFDISRPGEPIEKKMTTPTRRSKHGQKGIIACMNFNPDYSGLLAAGSLSKSIGIYDTNNSNELVFQQKKLKGGVIQVQFSPDGNYLYSVSRQTDGIICWDIRNTGKKLCEYTRPGKTNQRISFDISQDGKYLISGDKEGYINIYELIHFVKSPEYLNELNNQKVDFKSIKPQYRYKIQNDTITSSSFHPYYPLIFTCSGQRIFQIDELNDDDSQSDNENNINNDNNVSTNTIMDNKDSLTLCEEKTSKCPPDIIQNEFAEYIIKGDYKKLIEIYRQALEDTEDLTFCRIWEIIESVLVKTKAITKEIVNGTDKLTSKSRSILQKLSDDQLIKAFSLIHAFLETHDKFSISDINHYFDNQVKKKVKISSENVLSIWQIGTI